MLHVIKHSHFMTISVVKVPFHYLCGTANSMIPKGFKWEVAVWRLGPGNAVFVLSSSSDGLWPGLSMMYLIKIY